MSFLNNVSKLKQCFYFNSFEQCTGNNVIPKQCILIKTMSNKAHNIVHNERNIVLVWEHCFLI